MKCVGSIPSVVVCCCAEKTRECLISQHSSWRGEGAQRSMRACEIHWTPTVCAFVIYRLKHYFLSTIPYRYEWWSRDFDTFFSESNWNMEHLITITSTALHVTRRVRWSVRLLAQNRLWVLAYVQLDKYPTPRTDDLYDLFPVVHLDLSGNIGNRSVWFSSCLLSRGSRT